jgi:NAD(P)-dependent dehydrogenase (short-subunit alcohol dehydrogenase family)
MGAAPESGARLNGRRPCSFGLGNAMGGTRLPVGRVKKLEDIAEAYRYLMKTGFSTGETIVVNGGALQALP